MSGGVKAAWACALAVSGLMLGAANARAADLGGDCCGDLEERVAELEATTARKGNRKVSLKISGWVNEQVLFWDDGRESNVYVGNNDQERSRFKFAGEAKIDKDWSAGYTLEIGVRDTKSSSYSEVTDEGGTGLDVRKSSWFIKSKTYGKLTVGRDGSATYHLLDDSDFTNTRYYADAESMPTIGIAGFNVIVNGVNTGLLWGGGTADILPRGANNTPANGERPDIVRYDTPTFQGFSAQVAYGEDDMWDTALIYEGEHGDFKMAGRIGYAEYTDADGASPGGQHCAFTVAPLGGHCNEFGGSATIMHVPTGIFVYGAYGQKQDDDLLAVIAAPSALAQSKVDDEDRMYYVQAGIERKWHPLGTTTVFGSFRKDEGGSRADTITGTAANGLLGIGAGNFVSGSEVDTWSGGVVQNIAAAATDLYLIYSNVDGEFTTTSRATGASSHFDIDEFQMLQAGARVQF